MTLSTGALVFAAGLSLQMTSPQEKVLVGEPVKLVLEWRARETVAVHLDDPLQYLECWVDNGSGPQRYVEMERSVTEKIVLARQLAPGEETVSTLVLVRGSYNGAAESFLFPKPGNYSLRLAYTGVHGKPHAESNLLTFSVTEPTGEDKDVFELLEKDSDFARSPRAEALFNKHRNSPYLRLAGLIRLQRREATLLNHRDPDTGETLWHLDRDAFDALCSRYFRQMAADLAAGSWGPFEEERLELEAGYLEKAHDTEAASKLRKELQQRFPRSSAAMRVKQIEAEEAAENDEPGRRKPSPKPQL